VIRARFLLAVAIAWRGVGAQQVDSSLDRATRLVAEARAATARFHDRDVAIAENYVKVGPDFPAMGEHWVNGELIMKNVIDPKRPAILTYMDIGGKPTLTGVVYALTLGRGETPPHVSPSAQWHEHIGTIDEESLLFGHDHHADDDQLRLVVMHAWIWEPNPAGPFATDNWALPFAWPPRGQSRRAPRVPRRCCRALHHTTRACSPASASWTIVNPPAWPASSNGIAPSFNSRGAREPRPIP
jgi:hypothetical protein